MTHAVPPSLEDVIVAVLTEHGAGQSHRDGRYHCKCGWVSPKLIGPSRVEPDPNDPSPRSPKRHRARAIEAAVRAWFARG